MTVILSLEQITGAVRGAKVGLLSNSTFWVEQAGSDLIDVVKAACQQLVVLYAEHGPRGCEGGGEPSGRVHDPYLACDVRSVSTLEGEAEPLDSLGLDLLMVGAVDNGCRH